MESVIELLANSLREFGPATATMISIFLVLQVTIYWRLARYENVKHIRLVMLLIDNDIIKLKDVVQAGILEDMPTLLPGGLL